MYYPQEKVPLPVGGSGPHVRLGLHGSLGPKSTQLKRHLDECDRKLDQEYFLR